MALPDRFWPTQDAIATLASRAKCALLAWCVIILPLSLPLSAQDLPAGTILEAQLSMATGSRISHPGEPIEVTIIAPVSAGGGRILIPDGSVVSGVIENVNPIRLGLKHTTASIGYNFDALRLRNGETVRIKSQVVEVETAKERVDVTGTVQGIHPIASVSSMLDFFVVPLCDTSSGRTSVGNKIAYRAARKSGNLFSRRDRGDSSASRWGEHSPCQHTATSYRAIFVR
jgi:hypothetical protein